jgi:hypothetical protein
MIRIHINNYELGLVFRRGDLRAVLDPGAHLVTAQLLPGTRIERVRTLVTRFTHQDLDALVRDEALRARLVVVDLAESQRAIVWRDGRLYDFVGPGRYAYWKEPCALQVEVFDVTDVAFEHPQRDAVLAHPGARGELAAVDVESHERLLVRRGGELLAVRGAGRHAFWTRGGLVRWTTVDLREQLADVSGQEIMTADKVTLRMNLVVSYRITDPVAATTVVGDAAAAVYRSAQLALRAAVGGRDLEHLLADKPEVATEVEAAVAARARQFGVAIAAVGIRDIVLPGEMKAILNQVIEAQKQAEANLIRRREETAAARSQANTARLLAEHPVLLRMKELESLESILRGARSTFVFGSGDLARSVQSLVAARDEP